VNTVNGLPLKDCTSPLEVIFLSTVLLPTSSYLKSLLTWLFRLILVYPTFLLLLLHLTTINSHAAQVTLEWDAVNHPLLGGYMVYYGTYSGDYDVSLDVGNWTSCTIADVEENETYYFAVTAYSTEGEESDFSNEVSHSSSNSSKDDFDVGIGGGCFIATASFGSSVDPQVSHLKDSKDEYSLKNAVGKWLVKQYHRYGPHSANSFKNTNGSNP